jgi:type I restriction enzyme S subunit
MSEANGAGEIGLPTGWVCVPLATIAQINPPLDRCIVNDTVDVNFVPMRAVESEGGGLVRPEVRPYCEVKKGYTAFLSGDVIMAKITPCMENGKTTVVPDLPGLVCFGSTEFHVIRPENGVAARWIARFLVQHELRRNAQRAMTGGVGQMRVPAAFLESVRIPVAPMAEQERIVDTLDELLSDLGAGMAALERVREKLTLYRASLLKAALEGALTVEWRRQHPQIEPASELLKRILTERRRRWEEDQLRRFKEKGRELPKNWKARYKEPTAPDPTQLSKLPEGWCWASLDQVADIAGGVTKGQKLSPQQKTRVVPYLRVANVQRGYLDLSEIKEIRALEGDINGLRLEIGDILFNEGGDRDKLGRGWIWEGQIEECIHQNHVFRARLLTGDVQPKLVSWCGNSYGQQWFMRTGRQSVNLACINMTILRSFPVPLPPAAEQEPIVEAVEDQLSIIDHLEADLDAKLGNVQTLRQSILRHAFTGNLVPQNPKDEPASELLKRMAVEREQRAHEAAAARRLKARKPRKVAKAGTRSKRRAATKETHNGRIADR